VRGEWFVEIRTIRVNNHARLLSPEIDDELTESKRVEK